MPYRPAFFYHAHDAAAADRRGVVEPLGLNDSQFPLTPSTSPVTGFDHLFPSSAALARPPGAAPDFGASASSSLELAALYARLSSMSPALDSSSSKLHPLSKELDFSSFNAELTVYPFDIVPVPVATSAAALDAQLDSPLGLTDDSPYSQYLVSPMFASPELPSLDASPPPSLFPPTAVRPNPPPPTRAPSAPSRPAPSARKSSEPTGFRSLDIPLLPLDAPVQPRTYLAPSATSRKRTITAVERDAKRSRLDAPADEQSSEPTLAEEVVAQIERKRLQNTVAARRSRARKQERLGELEDHNERLAEENAALRARVALLEGVMTTVGLTPP